MRIAVTGATGFVGGEVMRKLASEGHELIPVVRTAHGLPGEVVVGPLEAADFGHLRDALGAADAIAHLAARTHAPPGSVGEEEAFRMANTEGTRRLLDAAIAAGVPRLVYVSSIKVNGEATRDGRRFTGEDTPNPFDAYARTKLEAEGLIVAAARASGTQAVILRPPLIYGAGVGGNFARLLRAIRAGIPLPFKLLRNRRSLISVRNMADVVEAALCRPSVGCATITVSDDEDVSTRELVEAMGEAIGIKPRLVPVPPIMLTVAGHLAGRAEEVGRLTGDLLVDNQAARRLLGWSPSDRLRPALRSMLASDN